ncbi:unnamed protein product, partial [Nesidiocoris tenuis]
ILISMEFKDPMNGCRVRKAVAVHRTREERVLRLFGPMPSNAPARSLHSCDNNNIIQSQISEQISPSM